MLYFYCDTMKKIKIILIILLIIILIPVIINFYIIFSTIGNIYNNADDEIKYDIALILGCSVLRDNKPSKMLEDRLNTGILLYNNKNVSKLLISGDHKEGYSEIDVMYNYLIQNGINENDILVDMKGYSTSESLINYKNNYSDKSVIIVTQKYHLYRAIHIANKLKIDNIGIPAKLVNYDGFVSREIREILARNKDFFLFLTNNWK